jgi:phage recombination protein Bet
MSKELVPSKGNALNALASRLVVDPANLKATLKATAFSACKTDEEFIAAVIVANSYGLNPLTKEIYAFAGKSGGVVPVVSTDGWTRLMVNHQNYKNHKFVYSDDSVTMPGAKPCPEWCEIHIEKKDGSITITREYLDEVFRVLTYANPWQTHTKRFLRHKTKIQGARETFGFGGIYDEDEAERIHEGEDAEFRGKPAVRQPEEVKATEIKPDQPATSPAAETRVPCCQACGTEGEVNGNGLCVNCATTTSETGASGVVLTDGQEIPKEYWDLKKTHPSVAKAMIGSLHAVKDEATKKWYARA